MSKKNDFCIFLQKNLTYLQNSFIVGYDNYKGDFMIGETNQSKRIELEVKRLGIFELRALAREVGVQSPTTKKREELIVNILERINNGQLDDVVVTKKGRPYKRL